ncbi:MAG: VOC family protein [Pseudomonadota bacterium]
MKLNPYLTFDGHAAEAAQHYAQIFDTDVEAMVRFGEIPAEDQSFVNDDNKNRVAHARVPFPNGALMISDTPGGMPFDGHSGFSLNVTMEDVDTGRALFDKLAAGGAVQMAYEPTFWAKGFGVCQDRFGVSWMVNVE